MPSLGYKHKAFFGRSWSLFCFCAILLLLTSCVSALRKREYPLGYREVGLTSWYGKDFHGRPTASGEIYNMFGISAAHKTLPLGTLLLVTDKKTGQSVKVKVNDRGPFVGKRILDLSYGAAKQLGIVEAGLAKIELRIIGRAPILRPSILPKTTDKTKNHDLFVVQIGSYRIKENALRMKTMLTQYNESTFVDIYKSNRLRLYRVRIGPYHSKQEANAAAKALRSQISAGEEIFPIVLEAKRWESTSINNR